MRILLIDTCGDGASLALAENSLVVSQIDLPARSASAILLTSVTALLEGAGWTMTQLEAVGVVSGPGSFTGVRVGLSCAKGLCEALSVPLATVSRLKVLADAANLQAGFAVLKAGRGDVFLREVMSGKEFVNSLQFLPSESTATQIAVCEPDLLEKIAWLSVELHHISAANALPAVLKRLNAGGDDPSEVDANYLRDERQIYGKPTGGTVQAR